jgi:hypothetical protein
MDQSSDSTALYAEAMMRGIKSELPDAAYVTREDLLQLACFQHVATITRYRYVCLACRYAINRKWLIEGSGRTDLYVSGQRAKYVNAIMAGEEYFDTIAKLIPRRGTKFTVMWLIANWTTDQHLTTNTKRVYVRNALRNLLGEGVITQSEFNIYERK